MPKNGPNHILHGLTFDAIEVYIPQLVPPQTQEGGEVNRCDGTGVYQTLTLICHMFSHPSTMQLTLISTSAAMRSLRVLSLILRNFSFAILIA